MLFSLLLPPKLAAQDEDDKGGPGLSTNAAPGIHRVVIPVAPNRGLGLAASSGFGYTESIGEVEGAHYRLKGVLGATLAIVPWFTVGLSFDGYYDIHPEDEEGSDSSMVGNPRLSARGGYEIAEDFQLGLSLDLWVPGSSAPSIELDASTLDTKLLIAWVSPNLGLTLGSFAGFRWDNSGKSAPPLSTVRSGDRLSLGLSDFNALVVGLGASYWLSDIELLAELSWDILLGNNAPSAIVSPLRATVGVRIPLIATLNLEVMTETLLSKRPEETDSDTLIPIEPRFTVLAGLRYALNFDGPTPQTEKEKTPIVAPPVEEKPVEQKAQVQGAITDEKGEPITSAHVQIRVGEHTQAVDTGPDGKYQFEDVPLGQADFTVSAEGFEDTQWAAPIDSEQSVQESRTLNKTVVETNTGQLRGLVRSFGGKPLSATITIKPLDIKIQTDHKGEFQAEVPPGTYRIAIRSYGFRTQRTKVKVEKNGVSILNADMRKKRK